MNKKIIYFGMISMLLLVSFTTLPVIGLKTKQIEHMNPVSLYSNNLGDTTPPESAHHLYYDTYTNGWYLYDVEVLIAAFDDESDVRSIHYIFDDVETTIYGDYIDFTIYESGRHTLEFWAIDNAGNIETPHHVVSINIDNENPSVEITSPKSGETVDDDFDIEVDAYDADSGVANVMFYLNEQFIGADSEAPYSITCSIEQEGDAKIEVLARDSVGNMNYDSVNIAHPRSKERTANPFIMMLFARFLLLQHFLKL